MPDIRRSHGKCLALSSGVCYTSIGLRNAAKGGAPWRHAQNIDDKNQIAREPVFQAERVPERTDRTLLFPKWGNQHLRESHGKAYAGAYAFFFCAEN